MTARETRWVLRDRMSGPPYRQLIYTSKAAPADPAYEVYVDHVRGCPICRTRTDGGSCVTGAALWRETRAGGTS